MLEFLLFEEYMQSSWNYRKLSVKVNHINVHLYNKTRRVNVRRLPLTSAQTCRPFAAMSFVWGRIGTLWRRRGTLRRAPAPPRPKERQSCWRWPGSQVAVAPADPPAPTTPEGLKHRRQTQNCWKYMSKRWHPREFKSCDSYSLCAGSILDISVPSLTGRYLWPLQQQDLAVDHAVSYHPSENSRLRANRADTIGARLH